MFFASWPIFLVFFLLILALFMWHRGREWRAESGVPEGDVIYTDTGSWHANEQVLHVSGLRLVGKPDYLVRRGDGTIIPVEVKSGAAPETPWEGQILQLAAYCLLVDDNFGVRPPYGILQYRDRAFAVDYTEDLEADLLDLLAEMRSVAAEDDPEPDHDDWRRCAACGVRQACDYRLA